MQPEKNKNPRVQKVEDFLLNPEKVVFESLEEFGVAVNTLIKMLEGVDLSTLEQLHGTDGKNPERGVDYFTEEDMTAIEQFIMSKVPVVGKDLPSVEQVRGYIREAVASLPNIKGDKGDALTFDDLTDAEKEELRGKDGNTITPEEVVSKLRELGKNQGLKIKDIRGLRSVVDMVERHDEEIMNLESKMDQKMQVVMNAPQSSSTGGGTGEGEANTASNIGDGADIFSSKVGVDLQFKGIKGANNKIAAAVNGDNVELTIAEANLAVDSMTEGSTKKFMTAAERTKVGYITVTQAVDLDTIESRVNALDAAVVLKGAWDASAGTFPGSGSAQAGDSYIVSVAGTVNSIAFAVNDRILAILDNASTTVYATNWLKLDYTDQVLSVAGKTGAVTLDAADIAETAGLKIMTDAERTKLSGIETAADVTDAANVGTVNAAAASKTTPVNADSFPIVNSESSNVIGRVTFTNFKAFLKTYFDTLYAALAGSITQAFAVSTLDLGHATDTTLSRLAAGSLGLEGVAIPTISSTHTFTNKRTTKRVGSTTSSATPTINTDSYDVYKLTAQTVDITSFTTNLSGTPTDGQTLVIQITGTAARAITWGASFEASTVALPTTTVTTAMLTVGFMWNAVTSKWRCVASA
jgi:hypothetical protein